MDSNIRTSIVTAAVIAAGPAGEDRAAWQTQVHENAVSIAVMSSETSQIAKAIDQIEKCKVFSGSVVAVKKEQSSTRGIVTLNTGTDRVKEGLDAGCEQVRTERTDNPFGLAMARKARELIGHRVLVWVEVEEIGDRKVRVLRHLESLGLAVEVAKSA